MFLGMLGHVFWAFLGKFEHVRGKLRHVHDKFGPVHGKFGHVHSKSGPVLETFWAKPCKHTGEGVISG